MRSDEILASVYEVEQAQQAQQQQAQQAAKAGQKRGSLQIELSGASLGVLEPVLSLEKTDLMFWMMLIQTGLLFLIWRQG